MTAPTACCALFSARTTPKPQNLVEPSWNPGGTLVEPWSNPRGTLPQGRPGPPRSLSGLRPQSFQLVGKNTELGARFCLFLFVAEIHIFSVSFCIDTYNVLFARFFPRDSFGAPWGKPQRAAHVAHLGLRVPACQRPALPPCGLGADEIAGFLRGAV